MEFSAAKRFPDLFSPLAKLPGTKGGALRRRRYIEIAVRA